MTAEDGINALVCKQVERGAVGHHGGPRLDAKELGVLVVVHADDGGKHLFRPAAQIEHAAMHVRHQVETDLGRLCALRHAAPEIDQTHGYIADVAAALRQAIEVRDEKLIKSYRRSLRSAMVRMKEVATRTVQSQKWDPSLVAEFMQDVDGSTSELLKNANAALMQLDQKTLTTWANDCAEQGRQVMHLAAEAYELLTPDAWTLEDCDEYMIELDEELKRLKDLFKLFSTDRLNLAMRREAAKLTNIRLGWKGLPGTNALAYLKKS